jgi:hypothetical protein
MPDIPLPPEMAAVAVENPGQWTRLSATEVVALARAQDGANVGTHPVVRFVWLKGGVRGSRLADGPIWIVLSDDVPMGPALGDEPMERPKAGLTWTYLSAKGEVLGSSSMSSPLGVPSLPPP